MDKSPAFRVIVAPSADHRYVEAILPYLQRNFTLERVIEIDAAIGNELNSLRQHPNRGSIEHGLSGKSSVFRYVLFRQTRHFELKIIYFVNDLSNEVYVVDYFPTVMHPDRMSEGK
jgi:plasmid stabilization system protein ParE